MIPLKSALGRKDLPAALDNDSSKNIVLLDYSGDVEVNADFQAGLISGAKINDAGACIKWNFNSIKKYLETVGVSSTVVDTILNAVLVNGPPGFCFQAQGNPNALTFASCSATVGTKACQSCTVCPDGQSFTVDCSNINMFEVINPIVGSLVNYPGPKVTCIGLDLIQGST
jgi:hypothetical protein